MYKKNVKNKKHSSRRLMKAMVISALLIIQTATYAEATIVPESTVVIQFISGDAGVPPLDPDFPVPEEGEGGGDLMLNHVSPLTFEGQEVSAIDKVYYTETLKPYIQVTDMRGTGSGWSVSAKASTFINNLTESESLLGSTITFKDASCISPTPEIPAPIPRSEVELPADGNTESPVVSAGRLAGMGTWLTKWYTTPVNNLNESVILSVPGGSALKGSNKAIITWFLSDTPEIE